MDDNKKEIFTPEKNKKYNTIFDMGDEKYKKCPVCKEDYVYPDEFISEGLCHFCADHFLVLPNLFKRYLKAIKKGYIRPVQHMHDYFFSND